MASTADPMPPRVAAAAAGERAKVVWRNELGGVTYRAGDRYIKWNPTSTGLDLERERDRLQWLAGRHPAPEVIDFGANDTGQWLVTVALGGTSAIDDRWQQRPTVAIAAIASGLRALHAVGMDSFPQTWSDASWATRTPARLGPRPLIESPVLIHGDACSPNTLIGPEGAWVGNVDFGDLAVGDRWADLAVASTSVDRNYGGGHQDEFFAAYGIDPDPMRIAYYRQLWHLCS